jgi:hypothetical protein
MTKQDRQSCYQFLNVFETGQSMVLLSVFANQTGRVTVETGSCKSKQQVYFAGVPIGKPANDKLLH